MSDAESDRSCTDELTEEWGIGLRENPMMNDVVLESLFKCVDNGKDLKSCRLVCSKWSVLTVPFARSRFQITIFGTKSNNSEQSRGIENFVKLIESNTLGVPFGRFRLGAFDTTTGPGQKFLEICGKTATEFCLDASKNHMIENVSTLLRSAPKLESFVMPFHMNSKDRRPVKLFPDDKGGKPKLNFLKSLDTSADYEPKRREICLTFYEELLGAAENISTVFIMGWYNYDLHRTLASDVLESIETLGRVTKIENLKVSCLSGQHLEILQRIGSRLKLKKLDLMVTTRPSNWLQFLELFRNTLECLDIMSITDSSSPIIFPRMPWLKELKLDVPPTTPVLCQNGNFNKTFPNLEKFKIPSEGRMFNVDDLLRSPEESQSKTMKALILGQFFKIGMERLDGILNVFPNLKMLNCRIKYLEGFEVIKKIWTHMPQLEGLGISGDLDSSLAGGENMDSLVTGIPFNELKSLVMIFHKLGIQEKSEEYRQDFIQSYANPARRLPSIHNLTNLRSLNLNIRLIGKTLENPNGNDNYLTDMCGYFGFYTLKNLRHLSIRNCEISKACAEILVKDKMLKSWKFLSSSKSEIIPSNWNPLMNIEPESDCQSNNKKSVPTATNVVYSIQIYSLN